MRMNEEKVTFNIFKSMQFEIYNNDVDKCFQVNICNEMMDGMFRNLTYKDAKNMI